MQFYSLCYFLFFLMLRFFYDVTFLVLDADKPNVSSAVENLADAVTHARFSS